MIVRPWMVMLALAVPTLALAQGGPAAGSSDLPPQERYNLRIEYLEFRPHLTGEVQKAFETSIPSLVDVVDDLNVPDERTFAARASLQLKPGNKLRLSYTKLDYQGDAIAQRRIHYGATQFEIGDRLVSTLKGNYYSAAYEWDFKKGRQGFLGLLVGGKGFDVDSVIVAPVVGKRETDTVRLPLPVIGVITRLYASRVSFEGELSGMTLGDRGKLLEAEVQARLHISDRIAAGVGYRYLSLQSLKNGSSGDLQWGGVQFGIEISL